MCAHPVTLTRRPAITRIQQLRHRRQTIINIRVTTATHRRTVPTRRRTRLGAASPRHHRRLRQFRLSVLGAVIHRHHQNTQILHPEFQAFFITLSLRLIILFKSNRMAVWMIMLIC